MCPEYMLKSEECLKKERERVTLYLSKSTEPKLVEQVQNELLVVVAKQLLENEHSGCRESLRDDKMDDLSRMFRLYRNIPQCLEPVVDIFKQHVTAEGHALIKLAEDAATSLASNTGGVQEQMLIRTIVELHEKRMAYVTECFQNHTLFHKALKEAFEIFCNKTVTGSSSAELLATFCDNILKKGGGTEKLDDAALEETLENVVKLLAYVSDKDFFAEFCRKKQSRRLLFDRSGHDEHEKSILSKLKEQSGGQFTSKMGGMVTDMTLARENQNHFEEYLKNSTVHPGIDLTVTVLTTGFWPTYKTSDLKLPSEMVKCVETFKIYSLGTCHMNGKFDQKPIELIVSSHQATVLLLLLFNNTERLSYNEMLEQLKLSHDDLLRVLHSVSCAKYKILKKEPMSKAISKSDVFEFNPKLSDRMRRIRVVPLPPMDERKKVVEDVDKDRGYAIDACVVRIMKARKVLAHQHLI